MLNAFRSSGRSKGTSIVVWVIIGLLVVGLTGFGLGGTVTGLYGQNVARVGDQKVERQEFVRALFNQIDALRQQTGQSLTVQQAQAFGLDQQVLSQLLSAAAVDGAAAEFGISAGDTLVRDRLLESGGFRGLTGDFDPEIYRSSLRQQGITTTEYENQIRRGISRTMLQALISDGIDMPDNAAETILSYAGERRSFSYVLLTTDDIDAEIAAPDEAALRAYYDENPDAYTLPEARKITYVSLIPEDVRDMAIVSDEDLEAEFAARASRYNTPESRIIDLLAFPDQAAADAARARLDDGEITFDELIAERGLRPEDASLGPRFREDLESPAREEVFAVTGPGIVGPVQTSLGPSLYRVNAIIAAQNRTLEDVADELRSELALRQSDALIGEVIEPVQDLLASGATLEEIAAETEMVLGTVDITGVPGTGLAADPVFRAAAQQVQIGDLPDLIDLRSGGVAALRLDDIAPPALQPFEDVREAVESDWRDAEEQRRLVARAEELQARLGEGQTFAGIAEAEGLDLTEHGAIERTGSLPTGTPPGMLSEIFELDEGGSTVLSDAAGVYLISLGEVEPVDLTDEAQAGRLEQIDTTLSNRLAGDLFQGYTQLLRDRADISVNQQLIIDTLSHYP